MKKFQYKCLLLITTIVFIFIGCGRKKMGIVDYQNYILNIENGIRIESIKGNIKTDFSLEPSDWKAFKYSYIKKEVNEDLFNKYKENNKGVLQFSFKIFLPQQKSLNDYFIEKYDNPQEVLLYAEYNLKDDFTLITPNGEINAMVAHHQPSFGLKPYEEFLVLFDTQDYEIENKTLEIIYKDHLFELDTLKYYFSEETMNNIPILSIK